MKRCKICGETNKLFVKNCYNCGSINKFTIITRKNVFLISSLICLLLFIYTKDNNFYLANIYLLSTLIFGILFIIKRKDKNKTIDIKEKIEIKEDTKKCKYCRSEIDYEATVCPICRKTQNISYKRIIAISSVLAIVLIGIIVNYTIGTYSYKMKVKSFINNIYSQSSSLEDIGIEVKKYWYDNIYNDKYNNIDDAVEQALKSKQDKINVIKLSKIDIDTEYKIILKKSIMSKEAKGIQEKALKFYEMYIEFYNFTLTPTGNYINFSNEFNSKIDKIVNEYDNLILLLE